MADSQGDVAQWSGLFIKQSRVTYQSHRAAKVDYVREYFYKLNFVRRRVGNCSNKHGRGRTDGRTDRRTVLLHVGVLVGRVAFRQYNNRET